MQVVFRLYFRSGWFFLEQGKSCCGLYIISWKVGFLHPSYFWGYGDVFEKLNCGDVIWKCKFGGFYFELMVMLF